MKNSVRSSVKSFSAMILIMITHGLSYGQTSRFGISLNSLTTNFNYGKSNRSLQSFKENFSGLQIGTFYQIGVTENFSLVPELYVALKGGVLNENNPETAAKSIVRTWSVETPVLARFHFKNFYVNTGPYVSYIFSGRMKAELSENAPGTSSTIKFGKSADEFRHVDVGAQVGAGYNFDLKKSVLTLDVRYGYGFVSISNAMERYNRMLNISLVVSKNKAKQ